MMMEDRMARLVGTLLGLVGAITTPAKTRKLTGKEAASLVDRYGVSVAVALLLAERTR
jgi:hypothetical protein